jgi:hypothetical protein
LDEEVFSDAEEDADAGEIDSIRARNAITASPAVNRDL